MTAPQPAASRDVQTLLTEGTLVGDWVLDPAASTVALKTRHTWGLRGLDGVFGQVEGEGTVAADGGVTGSLRVASASLNTKSKKRDSDLRSPRFFDVENHPHFVFAIAGVTPTSDGAVIEGSLTVLDRTLPLSFPATVTASGNGLTIEGNAEINRGDFGMTSNVLGMAAMDNTIVIRAVFAKR